MEQRTRHVLHTGAAIVFAVLAIAGMVLAVHLVRLGAYPAVGEGSLGHVGMVIAGLIAGFLAIVFALLALWAGLRVRRR